MYVELSKFVIVLVVYITSCTPYLFYQVISHVITVTAVHVVLIYETCFSVHCLVYYLSADLYLC